MLASFPPASAWSTASMHRYCHLGGHRKWWRGTVVHWSFPFYFVSFLLFRRVFSKYGQNSSEGPPAGFWAHPWGPWGCVVCWDICLWEKSRNLGFKEAMMDFTYTPWRRLFQPDRTKRICWTCWECCGTICSGSPCSYLWWWRAARRSGWSLSWWFHTINLPNRRVGSTGRCPGWWSGTGKGHLLGKTSKIQGWRGSPLS